MSSDHKSDANASVLAAIIAAGPAGFYAIGEYTKSVSPEVGLAIQILAGILGGVVGYATNRLASKSDAEERQTPIGPDAVGLNHHLARLAGQALRTIIEEQAQLHAAKPEAHAALAKAAERAPAAWMIMLSGPAGEHLRKLNSEKLADVVVVQSIAKSRVLVLSEQRWLPFAQFVLAEKETANPSALARALAVSLKKGFALHFCEHAKASAEKDPPAFAALLIQFLGEMRFTLRQHSSEFKAIRTQLDELAATVRELARTTVQNPGFDWEKLTTHLAETKQAHEEARDFYQAQGKNWDQLLPLASDTWRLVREVHGAQHEELIRKIAGLNLLVRDQVVEVLREMNQGQRDQFSVASLIVEFARTQRELDAQSRQQFRSFVERRDDIRGRGGHHYHQPEKWTPGHRTRKLWREPGIVFVPRPPLHGDDVPPPGTNYYFYGESGHGKSLLAANIADRLLAKGYRALTFNLRQASDILRHLSLLTDKEWLGLDAP